MGFVKKLTTTRTKRSFHHRGKEEIGQKWRNMIMEYSGLRAFSIHPNQGLGVDFPENPEFSQAKVNTR
jgi:hypothetical protein